jgi:hypothetical protein
MQGTLPALLGTLPGDACKVDGLLEDGRVLVARGDLQQERRTPIVLAAKIISCPQREQERFSPCLGLRRRPAAAAFIALLLVSLYRSRTVSTREHPGVPTEYPGLSSTRTGVLIEYPSSTHRVREALWGVP